MQMNIEDIKVKKRVRKDLGDLEPLKDSLRRYGLLNPITINSKNELIAGERRLESAKELGWTSVSVQIADVSDKASLLELEIEENTARLPFTEEELIEGYAELERLRHPGFFRRLVNSIKEFFTGIGETSAERRETKIKSSARLSLLVPLGVAIIIAGAVLYKTGVFSSVVRTFTDVIAILAIIVGAVFFARHIMLKR